VNTAKPSKAPVCKPSPILLFAISAHPQQTIIPAAEISVALVDIMGTITAMVEESLPRDLQAWAEGLTAKFAASFHATRASLTIEEVDLLRSGA